MSLVKGNNSYVTCSEADDYFATRVDTEVWFNTLYAKKASALITATGILDESRWAGVAEDEAQLLAFPRKGHYFDPRLGRNVSLSGVPQRLQSATCEFALHLIINEGITDQSGSIEHLKISGIELRDIKEPPSTPSAVRRLIRPLIINGGAAMWWRAN